MFQGSFVAIVTPFQEDGKVDYLALKELVVWHVEEGTSGIVCCGTTGEGVVLSDLEKEEITKCCVETVQGKIPVIMSTGTSDTRQSVALTQRARALGAKGALVVTPYYNRPTQRGCLFHYQALAKVGLPLIVYHNPSRAAVHLELETILEIAKIPEVVAIKESSHDLGLLQQIVERTRLSVLSGEDDQTLEAIQKGAKGAICVVGNIIPRAWSQMIRFALEQKWEEAERIRDRHASLCKALFLETNPQCVKYALKQQRRGNGVLRLPLVEPTGASCKKVEEVLSAIDLR